MKLLNSLKPVCANVTWLFLLICFTGVNAQYPRLTTEKAKQIKAIDSVFYFKSQGDTICYRKWGNSEIKRPDKVMLIIHGIGYHSLPFMKIMNYIEEATLLVYAMDLRGHGLSGKTKGVLESNDKVLTDMDNMIAIIKKENPYSQIFLLGSSMGGIYSLGYLINKNPGLELSGLILVGVPLILNRSQVFQLSNLKLPWLMIFDQSRPSIKIDGKKIEASSANLKWIESRRRDTLALSRVSLDYLREVHKMQKTDKRKSNLSLISVPVLIQHGGKDKIAALKGAYYLNRNLKNTKADLRIYSESYHSLFFDRDSSRILGDIVKWVTEN